MLRPLVIGIEAIARSQADTTKAITALQETISAQSSAASAVGAINDKLDQKASLNERLFDALHEELRTYKDNFLFDTLQKPIIKDLITLHDDLTALKKQVGTSASSQTAESDREKDLLSQMINFERNLDHSVHALEEIMARMEVERLAPHEGKLDKTFQKAVSVELSPTEEDHDVVLKSLRPGFRWRERVIRPEEVVIKKHSPSSSKNPSE